MKFKLVKVSTEFDNLVEKIARQKIINGTAKELKSRRRITLAMSRHPEMKFIAEDIMRADLEEE